MTQSCPHCGLNLVTIRGERHCPAEGDCGWVPEPPEYPLDPPLTYRERMDIARALARGEKDRS